MNANKIKEMNIPAHLMVTLSAGTVATPSYPIIVFLPSL